MPVHILGSLEPRDKNSKALKTLSWNVLGRIILQSGFSRCSKSPGLTTSGSPLKSHISDTHLEINTFPFLQTAPEDSPPKGTVCCWTRTGQHTAEVKTQEKWLHPELSSSTTEYQDSRSEVIFWKRWYRSAALFDTLPHLESWTSAGVICLKIWLPPLHPFPVCLLELQDLVYQEQLMKKWSSYEFS